MKETVINVQTGEVVERDPVYSPDPPAPPADVNAERDRRLSGTFVFMGERFDCDAKSLQRITGAATLAGFAIASGAQAGNLMWHGGSQPFGWISADNQIIPMDAPTTFAFGQAAATNESAHITAARALKDASPIPADYTADKWWP